MLSDLTCDFLFFSFLAFAAAWQLIEGTGHRRVCLIMLLLTVSGMSGYSELEHDWLCVIGICYDRQRLFLTSVTQAAVSLVQ